MSVQWWERLDGYDFEGDEELQCAESCPHFDGINQCCWLITAKTPGLCTDVEEGDYCFHGLKVDANNMIVYPKPRQVTGKADKEAPEA